jgi:hypothetical protein
MPERTYKVSGKILIQEGKHSYSHKFKDDLTFNGQISDVTFGRQILRAFDADMVAEAEQTQLTVQPGADKPDAGPKKITEPKPGQEPKKK